MQGGYYRPSNLDWDMHYCVFAMLKSDRMKSVVHHGSVQDHGKSIVNC